MTASAQMLLPRPRDQHDSLCAGRFAEDNKLAFFHAFTGLSFDLGSKGEGRETRLRRSGQGIEGVELLDRSQALEDGGARCRVELQALDVPC